MAGQLTAGRSTTPDPLILAQLAIPWVSSGLGSVAARWVVALSANDPWLSTEARRLRTQTRHHARLRSSDAARTVGRRASIRWMSPGTSGAITGRPSPKPCAA